MYEDGYSLFCLNGIKIPKEVITAKPSEITKDMVVKEKNADVRREIIRKLGPERLSELLDFTILDKADGYELISFDIGDGRTRPFLRMKNPSVGLTHIEGVRPEITTVHAALAYRNGLKEYVKPQELS
jgi:hypothetical protein